MKKIILVICMCLSLFGCYKPKYTLYFFYASTCPVCKSFRNNVIPDLKDTYSNDMKIIEMDIDDDNSQDKYAYLCSLLKGYAYTDTSGNVPFIVLDGYFARVGYEIGGESLMKSMISDAIENKDLTQNEDYDDIEYYIFEDNI